MYVVEHSYWMVSLPDDGSDVVKDASFTEYIDDLKIIDPKSYEVPDSLKHILRPYQVEGFQWLNTLCDKGFGGILADEMGLANPCSLSRCSCLDISGIPARWATAALAHR